MELFTGEGIFLSLFYHETWYHLVQQPYEENWNSSIFAFSSCITSSGFLSAQRFQLWNCCVLLYYRVTEFFLRNCLKQDFLIFIWMLWKREMPVFQNWTSCALIALDLNRNVFTRQSQYEQLSSFKGYHCQQTKSPFLSFLIVPVQKKHIDNQVPVHEAEL